MRAGFKVAGLAAVMLALGAVRAAAQCDAAIDLGRGRINLHIPPSYDGRTPVPLVILLHGYTSSGAQTESYVRFAPLANEYGFVYAYPDGTRDFLGNRFWNATDACCNFFGSNVDDSQYLLDLIDAIKRQCNIDPRRVHFVGHSNGGFMSYRMACDHSDVVASIASLAGMTFENPNDCGPAEPVHVLHIHGTNDSVIFYPGGCLISCYPGAVESAEQWASFAGCSLDPDLTSDPLDLDAGISGNETLVAKYETSCDPRGSAELWTIVGGEHSPNLSSSFSRLVVEWLLAHPKPGGCTGAERLSAANCRDKRGTNVLKVKLADGQPGDTFRVTITGGASDGGTLNNRGKGSVRFRGVGSGGGQATATWGCGATDQETYTCP